MQPFSMDDKKNPELSQTLTTSLASPVPAVVEQTGDNDVSKTIQPLSRKKKSTGRLYMHACYFILRFSNK